METNLERAVRIHEEFMDLSVAEADAGARLLDELAAAVALLTPGEHHDFLRETEARESAEYLLTDDERRRYRAACLILE